MKSNIFGFIAILLACFSLGMSIGNVINKETRYIVNLSESDTELLFEALDEIVSQGGGKMGNPTIDIEQICGNCKWHKADKNNDWICCNGESEYCSDFTDYADECREFERR